MERLGLVGVDVFDRVEEFICKQLGEDVVEFKKPKHTLDDVVGFSKLKDFEAYFNTCNGHPNASGYKLMARTFAKYLAKSGHLHSRIGAASIRNP